MKHLWNKLWFVSIFTVFAFTFQKWYPWDEKPLVSGCETLEFSLWNPWFHDVKTRLSDCNLMGFRTQSQNCIFMQFWGGENCMRFSEKKNNTIIYSLPSLNKIYSFLLLLPYIFYNLFFQNRKVVLNKKLKSDFISATFSHTQEFYLVRLTL